MTGCRKAEKLPCIIQTADNVLLLEVNNLLTGWPTYIINFTPEQPGPLVRPDPLNFKSWFDTNTFNLENHSTSQRCLKRGIR